jgi:hypothetical protein
VARSNPANNPVIIYGGAAAFAIMFISMMVMLTWQTPSPGEPDVSLIASIVLFTVGGVFTAFWMVAGSRYEIGTTEQALAGQVVLPGQLEPTRQALGDMCVAAGVKRRPTLYLIKSPFVNAYVLSDRWQLGEIQHKVFVTSAMTETFTFEEQRAVFAFLLAAITRGSVSLNRSHGLDLAALELLKEPEPLLSALRKAERLPRQRSSGLNYEHVQPFLDDSPAQGLNDSSPGSRLAKLREVSGVAS